MRYTAPSFSVNPSEAKAPEDCQHGWVAKNRCILCGEPVAASPYERETTTVASLRVGCRGSFHAFDLDAARCDCGAKAPPERWLGWKREA